MNMPMPMPAASNHGFSLLGKNTLVLSHIPMFMAPHQAQMFLEVTLAGAAGQDPTKIYLDDMAKTHTTDYVLLADPLVLPTLGPAAPHRLESFTGKLFRGWPFNNPNTAPVLAENVTVHVKKSLYFHPFTMDKPVASLTYLGFRTPETSYLVHKLVQPPDLVRAPQPPGFCQILSGSLDFDRVQEIAFPGLDDPDHRLKPNQKLDGECGKTKVRVQTHDELIFDPNHLV
jgi:hypothetical protein